MTQPTVGLGLARPTPLRASSSARCMKRMSCSFIGSLTSVMKEEKENKFGRSRIVFAGAGLPQAWTSARQRVGKSGSRAAALHIIRVRGLIEERIGVGFGVEGNHVVDLFAGADEANGQAEFAGNGNDDAAFGGAIKFGENDSSDADRAGEFA